MRGTLLFLAGVLVGANAIYFLMVRSADCDCDGPAAAPVGSVAVAPSPATAPTDGDDATRRRDGSPGMRPAPVRPAPGQPLEPAPSARTTDPAGAASAGTGPTRLLIPVAGIGPSALTDTFDDKRGTNRIHEALDIMAPSGTPVVATADGTVEKLFDSDNGGLTIYQFDPTGTWCYYYAHLQRYAPGLEEGDTIRRGQVIGYVGATGNANPDAPHLHFGIFRLGPEKQWHRGTPVNPYPLLRGG